LIDCGQVIWRFALATVVQDTGQEVVMIQRAYFLHYRAVREVITTAVTIGAALLAGYFILWPGL
jgi:hypothetical protein